MNALYANLQLSKDMERVSAMNVPQVVAEETVVTTPSTSNFRSSISDDDRPPVITRYDKTAFPVSRHTPSPAASSTQRVVYSQRAALHQPSGKMLLIRRNDGTTQYLRPVPARKHEIGTRPFALNTADPVRRIASQGNMRGSLMRTTVPPRVLRVGLDGQRLIQAAPTASKILAARAGDNSISTSLSNKPLRHQPLTRQYDDEHNYGSRPKPSTFYPGQTFGCSVPRIVNRGGATMAIAQRFNPLHKPTILPRGRIVKDPRDPSFKFGTHDYIRIPTYATRPLRFEFESNEDEDREIAEAIEREEENMRREEEESKRGPDRQWNRPRIIDKYGQVGSAMLQQLSKQPLQFSSNLMIAKEDSPDTKQIKQTLDTMITQVCRWDKQYGWFKSHQKKPKTRLEMDKMKARRMFSNQRELMVAEHIDRLRREINKRRTKLEDEAERLCGLSTPWRKSKAKSKNKKTAAKKNGTTQTSVSIINPAEISLGGDLVHWDGKELKEEDEWVEDVQPPLKKPKVEVYEERGSPRKKHILGKTQRQRMYSHSSVEEKIKKVETPKKRGRPRKELSTVPALQGKSDDSDGDGIDHGIPEGMTNPNDPHCICKKPYNSKRFYISCGMCSGWFHGKCVGIQRQDCPKMTSWHCPECTLEIKKDEESEPLYCFCKKPYDENLFYVGCDSCEDWFHPECVGITQEYVLNIAEYICPRCSNINEKAEGYESAASASSSSSNSPPLSRADYPKVWGLLELICEHEKSSPFKEPVDPEKALKNPIDLQTIRSKLERLEYINLKDFASDMRLMFKNAKDSNLQGSTIYNCATELEVIFEHYLTELRGEIIARYAVDRRKPSESHTVDSSLDIDTDQLIEADKDTANFDINQYIGI